jgi:hypothetical protein
MADWTLGTLLDHVQELLGEPVGAFYNISTRTSLLNQAQRTMVEETRALTSSDSIAVTAGTRGYDIPANFMTFDREAPYFIDSSGDRDKLEVVDVSDLDARYPNWQDVTGQTGTPGQVFLRNETLTLYPTPSKSGTLVLPYVVDPTELSQLDDVPFNGYSRLNRFAPALAYYAAFVTMMGRAPAVAMNYRQLFDEQVRLMRHYTRTSPQQWRSIRPTTEG